MNRLALICAGSVGLIATAGCDQATPDQQSRPTKITNPYHDQLAALPDDLQRLGLMRAIRDNGKRCQRVDAGRYQEDYRQMALWVARCSDDRQWGVFIAPNGDTQVRECSEMAQLELPPCRPHGAPDTSPQAQANSG